MMQVIPATKLGTTTGAIISNMEDTDRRRALIRLWQQHPGEKTGKLALLDFHIWLVKNRPELLKEDHRKKLDSYQQLKVDLRDYL
jgi:hypothetical protein